MGAGARGVNAVGVRCANPEDAEFAALYDEEVNLLANQGGGYHSNYSRQGGNQGVAGLNSIRWVENRHIEPFVAAEPSEVAPGTIIQVQTDTSGTNAQTDGDTA
uniref:Integrase core domain containing protein n=1 Tax=Solanum tuberosum TaxID=4113 RepID=M1DLD5_SOLTU